MVVLEEFVGQMAPMKVEMVASAAEAAEDQTTWVPAAVEDTLVVAVHLQLLKMLPEAVAAPTMMEAIKAILLGPTPDMVL